MSPWSAALEQTVLPPEPQTAQSRKTLVPLEGQLGIAL